MAGEVRALGPDEWRILRELRLAALLDAPEAFGGSYEQSLTRTEQEWRAWPGRGVPFAAFIGAEPVGIVAAVPVPTDLATVHLIAMWVAPAARGTGIAEALVQAVVDWAVGRGCLSVLLDVVVDNERAIRLYQRVGFAFTDEPPSLDHTLPMRRPLR